jgi:hypothetical protein
MSTCGDPSNPDSQGRSGPGRTWAAPVPGRQQGDRRRPATGLAARGRGCGASRPCSLSGSWWAEGGMADDGVAVLVVMAGVHVPPVLAMPQLPGDVRYGRAGAVGPHGCGCRPWRTTSRAALPARTSPRLPVQHPAVDRQADRQSPRHPGSTADSPWTAIYVLSCADATGGDQPSSLRVRGSRNPTAWAVVTSRGTTDESWSGSG